MKMKKIIGGRGTGKTRELIAEAAVNDGIIVCADPERMKQKLRTLGFKGIPVISYDMFLCDEELVKGGKYYIDDAEAMLQSIIDTAWVNATVAGFTVCTEEE